MNTGALLCAVGQLLRIDQHRLAELSGLAIPAILRMQRSEKVIHGYINSLNKLVNALTVARIGLIGKGTDNNQEGRRVRLRQ